MNHENCPGCSYCLQPLAERERIAHLASETALARQEAGNHYKDQAIQPIEYIHANGIGYCEGNVIKYVSRWRKKNGLQDLQKAKHYIELLIELEQKKEQA